MGKRKEQNFESVHIEYRVHSESLFKIVVGTFFHNEKLAEFFIPRKKEQSPMEVDLNAVKFRLRKDFGIIFDHNSATYYIDKY